ncbi:hypothetical protein [Serratia fonticola]|uniref:hypothetical protein n=1 Tax=Serratia fonticola TaxID=47917 RepID=UPI00217BBAA0|nr:hypothetical protein [Serratia fonticola]CAI0710076.1 Uncharacterised protein [Serratia fonticola]CAI0710925.1 Uncharacterised protein [Serratia fonticola]CAI1537399.1 Uncharacterised protein [Serratia fonticola]CAI1586805.1 Uncharacterised protein [Serratia fonticola]CAI1662998.1 Uncharacterised protein [Serratia fonticola]
MGKIYKILIAFKPLAGNLIFRFLVGIPLSIAGIQLSEYFQYEHEFFLKKIAFSVTLLIVYYFIVLSVLTLMFDRIFSFHEKNNAANLNKNPLKFAIKHRARIYSIYKWLFNLAFIWFFIVIWFYKEN